MGDVVEGAGGKELGTVDLHLGEGLNTEHVECRAPIDECAPHANVVDCRGDHQEKTIDVDLGLTQLTLGGEGDGDMGPLKRTLGLGDHREGAHLMVEELGLPVRW